MHLKCNCIQDNGSINWWRVNVNLDNFPKDSSSASGVYIYLCFLSGIGLLRCAHLVLVNDSEAVQCYIMHLSGILNHSPSRKLCIV